MSFATGLTLLYHALPIVARVVYRLTSFAFLSLTLTLGVRRAPLYHRRCVTSARLTQILRGKGLLRASERVKCIDIQMMEKGGIGDVSRVQLQYDLSVGTPQERGLPLTLVMKSLGTTVKDLVIGSLVPLVQHEHMAYTYEPFTKLVEGLQPKVYSFEMSPFGMGLLFMEDLGRLRNVKSRVGGNEQELRMVITTIAKLHSRTLNQHFATLQQKFQFHVFFLDQLTPINCKKALEGPWSTCLSEFPLVVALMTQVGTFRNVSALVERTQGFGIRTTNSHGMFAKPFSALIHGDVRLDNCFFDDVNQKAVMVDWQVVMPRCPLLDFGWLLLDANFDVLHHPKSQKKTLSGDELTQAKMQCKASIDVLLQHYLDVLSAELTACNYNGERPSMAYCQQMLPWIIVNDVYYVMVSVAQIFKVDPKSDPDNAVVQTFQGYLEKLEWLVDACLPKGFLETQAQ